MTRHLLLATALVLSPLLAAKGAFAQDEESSDELPPPPPPPDDIAGEAPPQQVEPPPQQPTQQTFDQQLSPYGRWVDTPEYGRVWVPSVNGDWQPYADGRWVDTSYGWSFWSPAPWGWIAFHYGRWGWNPAFGWYWVPGYRWGPAWVGWRHVNGYACWSPLAPRGYVYGPYWRGWVVVPHAHFTAPIRSWAIPPARVGVIVRSARPVRMFPSYRSRALVTPRPGGGWHRGRGVRK